MPGATETDFFRRAEMMDTRVGTAPKDDAAEVAKEGFNAMMRGESDIVTGIKNKIQTTVANVLPAGLLARQHRRMAEPGTSMSSQGLVGTKGIVISSMLAGGIFLLWLRSGQRRSGGAHT